MIAQLLRSAALLFLSGIPGISFAADAVIVSKDRAIDARFTGQAWERSATGFSAEGTGKFLHAKAMLGAGDFRVRATLQLERLDGSAASFEIGDSRFGFDGKGGSLFVEGPLFTGATAPLPKSSTLLKPSVPFTFEIVRTKGLTRFLLDGAEVHRKSDWGRAPGRIGLRPWRNRMTVIDFTIEGNLVPPPPVPSPTFLSGFAGGKDGYHTFRIPALAVTTKGTVLAFCEGRKNSWGDSSDIDLVLKRSTDHGKTWSAISVLWDDGQNTCGNPCVVVDRQTGAIFLLSTWNRGDDHEGGIIAGTSKDTRHVFVLRSDDDGLTWSKPLEITSDVKKPDWTWYATGPGSGIQIEHGPHKGRLVIPCDHIEKDTKHYFSHVIFSDDHGKTWQLGGRTPDHQVNECEVVELTGGKLMLNMRSYADSKRMRQTALSDDGGLTWKDQRSDPNLIEPICQAGIERYRWPAGDKPGVVLFSNPASTKGRVNVTLRASLDDGKTWARSKLLYEGPGAYSDLDLMPDGRIACLYEAGADNIAESIVFTLVGLDELQPNGPNP